MSMTIKWDSHASPWMDAEDAAAYAGVALVIVAAAVARGELSAVTTHPLRPWEPMLRARDVEAWAERRASVAL